MAISWYPGHMYKANKEMARLISSIDVIIEVLDARMPAASANPLLKKMRRNKPCLHLLNKTDLAEPRLNRAWQQYFNALPNSRALLNGKDNVLSTEDIITACQRLADAANPEAGAGKKYQAMVVGIPNVGKSTLINQILGRKIAKTGNEPAVTKGQQRIKLNEKWYLFDTPGVLWPRLEDQEAAYRLACAGAIRNTAVEFEDVAFFAAEFLLRDFPHLLKERYQLNSLPLTAEDLLNEIAGRRGCLRKNGQTDWHKISELLLNDYRSGKIGNMTLEAPPPLPIATAAGGNTAPAEAVPGTQPTTEQQSATESTTPPHDEASDQQQDT